MVNEKYIIAIDAADDAGMWPASRLAAVTCAGDGAVLVRFGSGISGGGGTGDCVASDPYTMNHIPRLTGRSSTTGAHIGSVLVAVVWLLGYELKDWPIPFAGHHHWTTGAASRSSNRGSRVVLFSAAFLVLVAIRRQR